MHIFSAVVIFSFFLPSTVFCGRLSCAYACQEALSSLVFQGTSANAGYYESQCDNVLRVKSLFICMRHYCTPRDINAGLAELNSTCHEYGSTFLPPYVIIGNITDEDAQTLRHIDTVDVDDSHIIRTVVFTSPHLFDLALRTIVSRRLPHPFV